VNPLVDTLAALEALQASGIPVCHPSTSAAVRYLSRARQIGLPFSASDACRILRLMTAAADEDAEQQDSLPPQIGVCDDLAQAAEFNTAAERVAKRAQPMVGKLIDDILQDQKRDGGFGSPERTGEVLEALCQTTGIDRPPAVDAAAAYLRNTQSADGSWSGEARVGCVAATSYAIRGLVAAGAAASKQSVAAAMIWLELELGNESAPVDQFDAASVLQAYVAAGQAHHRAALRAVQILIDSQDEYGNWPATNSDGSDTATSGQINNVGPSTTGPLLALSQWAVAAASTQPAESERPAFRLVGSTNDR
jgi:hypothetical protein